MLNGRPTFYEFFAGGGMARAGLGDGWECLFANDIDPMKIAAYTVNWGSDHVICDDVGSLKAAALPGRPDLVWASFPCQDVSLAGWGAGLGGGAAESATRSGTFWPFWSLMRDLGTDARAPRAIVLENVLGLLTSKGGRDFAAICGALAHGGYHFGTVVMDAADFVPQSRQRVFFIAVKDGLALPAALTTPGPREPWHSRALVSAQNTLAMGVRARWLWWDMPRPKSRNCVFADVIESEHSGVDWHTDDETSRLLSMMSPLNRDKVNSAKASGRRMVGGIYRRTRPNGNGTIQRAEVRFDDVSGCLRTPGGGSSRQTVIVVDGERVRSRLLSPREAARLMGLPDSYKLPIRYNDAYHVAGDGVCVPVVRHLAESLLEPIVAVGKRDLPALAA